MALSIKSLVFLVTTCFVAVHAQLDLSRESPVNTLARLKALSAAQFPADRAPTKRELSRAVLDLESLASCFHVRCDFEYAVLDLEAEKCICPWAQVAVMDSSLTKADRKCQSRAPCPFPYKSIFDTYHGGCSCSIFPLPPSGDVHSYIHEPSGTPKYYKISRGWWMRQGLPGPRAFVAKFLADGNNLRDQPKLNRRDTVNTTPEVPTSSHVVPPQAQLTRQELQDVMATQSDQAAIVTSVVPHFTEGIITFSIQLQGPIAQTIMLNASDTLPCATIGTPAQPKVLLTPSAAGNGSNEITIPDCSVFAVNMHNGTQIKYWIIKPDSSTFQLSGDNRITDIDGIDLSLSTPLSIRTVTSNESVKRAFSQSLNLPLPVHRHQLLLISCNSSCTHKNMVKTAAAKSLNMCGCSLINHPESNSSLTVRGVEQPDPYTATMTLETCRSMTCLNNGGNPALYNPFSKTCWCAAPIYMDANSSSAANVTQN